MGKRKAASQYKSTDRSGLPTELFNFFPKQLAACDAADTHEYTFYGGSRGPGKSYWLRWYCLQFLSVCKAYGKRDVVVGLFCDTYKTLTDRQVSKIATEFPRSLGEVKDSKTHGLGFYLRDGGGVIALRNLDDPSKYQGAEFALIAVDELTKIKVETFNLLRGSKRWSGIKNTRFIAAGNPGGIGHLWVKDYWIDKVYPPEMERLRDEFCFVPALPDDNPHLDKSYWQMLDTLPPTLAKAWRYGEWDVFEGQAFGQWRREKHVIEPIEIPSHWARFRGVDWGRANPFCCLWGAQDPDTGRVIIYRELYQTGLTDTQQARLIGANTPPSEKVNITYADPSMWTKKAFEDVTFSTADEYRKEGIILTKADNDRLTGKRKVDRMLGDLPDGRPALQIFSTCANLLRTLPALPYDTTNAEDVDSEAEDHAYDALRYLLTRVNARPKARVEVVKVDYAGAAERVLLKRNGAGMGSSDL